MRDKPYDLEERLVEYAAEIVLFVRKLGRTQELLYYRDQIVRSSGSAALKYGEVQGTQTDRDFIHKMSLVAKELKETRVALKILRIVEPW